ncbi:unnamed protein product [Brassica rapa subsp. trilocularis]
MIVNVYQIMRDPTVWKDPFMFVPERFLVSSEPDKVKKSIPFGSGRRVARRSSRYRYSGNCSGYSGAWI